MQAHILCVIADPSMRWLVVRETLAKRYHVRIRFFDFSIHEAGPVRNTLKEPESH